MAYSWTNNLPDGGALPENSAGTPLATLTAADGGVNAASYGIDNSDTYSNSLFEIDNNGVLSPKSLLNDYENDLFVRLRPNRLFTATVNAYCADGNVVASRLFVLTLQDVNEVDWVGTPPTGIAIPENNIENYGPILFNATDEDSTADVTYSLSGDDVDYFAIDAATGGLSVKSSLNYENTDHGITYSVIVNATPIDDGTATSTVFVLTVTNVDEQVEWQTNPTGNAGEVLENLAIGTAVATFSATDPEGGVAYYGLGASYGFDGGHQDDYFNIDISTGVLTIKSVLDFEDPDINGHYTLKVLSQAGDGNKGVAEHTFILTISDTGGTYEPSWSAKPNGATIAENNSINDLAANFWARDRIDGTTGPSAVSYSLSGADAEYFAIPAGNQSSTVPLTVKSILDYEEQQYYSVVVNAYDTNGSLGFGPALSQLFILTLTNVNEFTTAWAGTPSTGITIPENNPENFGPIVFNATDGDAVAVTYSLEPSTDTAPNDAAYFNLDANTGGLYVKSVLDFESPANADNRYSVIINATSADDSPAISTLYVLTVTDVVDEPAKWENNGNPTGGNLSENNATGVSLADFNAVDGNGDEISYSVSNLGDGSYFDIDATTGVLSAKSSFDYEDRTQYTALVQAQSVNEEGSNGIIQQIFVLTIDNTNNEVHWAPPSADAGGRPDGATLAENTAPTGHSLGREVGDFFARDIDNNGTLQSVNYNLSGPDANYFNIGFNNGKLYVKSTFDYEDRQYYSVMVNVYPSGNFDNVHLSSLFILTISDVSNEAVWTTNPTGNTISENIAIGTSVADFDSVNYDYKEKADVYYGLGSDYGFDGGHQDAYFNLDINTGVLTTKSELDFENTGITTGHYTILALSQAAEGKGVAQQIFVLTLADVNEDTAWVGTPSTGITIAENNPENFGPILFNAVDGDGAAVTYSLEPSTDTAPNDAAYFNLDANTGELRVKSSLDFEDSHGPTYSVIINATSTDGSPAVSQTFILTVTDVADEPTQWQTGGNPTGNAGEVLETIAIGTSVANFGSSDPEGAGLAYYGLGSDFGFDGGHQDAYFKLDLNTGELTTKADLDFETFTHYTILALSQAAEGNKGVAQQLFILTLGDVSNTNDWASDTTTGKALNENRDAPIALEHFTSNGSLPEGVNMTYAITGGDTDYFNIELRDNGQWRLNATASFDYESEYGQSINNRYSVVMTANATEEGTAISRVYILTIDDVAEDTAWVGTPSTGIAIPENNVENFGPIVFNATDGDCVAVTYSLSGDDAVYFNLDANTGGLYVKSVLNFEDPDHTDGLYNVIINANSLDDSAAISQAFVLTVTNVDEAVEWQTNPTGNAGEVLETIAIGTSLGGFSATDPEGTETAYYGLGSDYGFDGGHQDKYFKLNISTGELTTNSLLNFEEFTHYTIVALSQAGNGNKGVAEHTFILTITDVNEDTAWVGTPSASIAIAENNPENFGPIVFNATDGDGAAVTYSLSGDDVDYFDINANTGGLHVKSSLDFENTDHGITYSVIINATSLDDSAAISTLYVLTVTNVDEAAEWQTGGNPTGNAGEVLENIAIGTALATFVSADPEGETVYYDLGVNHNVGGGHQDAYFSLDLNSGELITKAELDFETLTHYTILALSQAAEGNKGVARQIFVLTLTDVDNTTAFSAGGDGLTISENNVVAFDAGDRIDDFGNDNAAVSITYGLSGDAADYFSIAATTGWLFVTSSLDFESDYGQANDNRYSVIITANAAVEGTAVSQLFILTVTDVNNTRGWADGTPGGITLSENLAIGAEVYNINAKNAATGGGSITFGISGTDANYFNIGQNNGVITFASVLDFENPANANNNLYSIIIHSSATIEGDAISRNFVLTITDQVIEWESGGNPTGNAIAENGNSNGEQVADFGAIDTDGATVTYSLSGGDSANFAIDAATGELTTSSSFNFEDSHDPRYSVVVIATDDADGDAVSQTFILTITDVDEPVVWQTNPTGNTISETIAIGTSVADFDAIDPEGGAALYGLGSDHSIAGGHQDKYFNINAQTGELTTKSGLDFETFTHYTILVASQAAEGDNAPVSQLFVLTITDVDNTTAFTAGGDGLTIAENNAVGFAAGDRIDDFGNAATSAGVSITYGLSGDAADYFSIAADTGWLFITSSLDYESTYGQTNGNLYSVTIHANANVEGDAVTQLFVLTVTDINETLFWESAGNPTGNAIDENNPATTLIADFGATHTDGSTNITYSLESGGADNSYFAIDAVTGELTTSSSFNFEDSHDPRYSVVVFATPVDDGSAASQTFILTINDVNEFTTGWGDNPDQTGATISENLAIGTSLADFNATDGDSRTTLTYSVAPNLGDGEYFAIDSASGILTTTSSFDFENPGTDNATNLYSVLVSANSNDASPAITQIFVLTIANVDNTRDWNANTATGVTRNENTNDTTLWDYRNDDNGGDLPAGVTITYGLSGEHAGDFTIGPREGGEFWRFRGGGDYDFESEYGQANDNRYSVIITANATVEGTAITRLFILTIADANESPQWSTTPSTGVTFAENNAVGFGPIPFNATDGDGATVTYSLSGTDAAYFSISAEDGGLYAASSFDFEDSGHTDGLYTITVNATATDDSPAVLSHTFILTITNINEPVEWTTTRDGTVVAENARSVNLGDFVAIDPDGADITYGIKADYLDAEYFQINATTGLLSMRKAINFEARPPEGDDERSHYSVVVQANSVDDNGNAPIEHTYILSIRDLAEDSFWVENPSEVTLNKGSTIAENNTVGGLLTTFSARDEDIGTTISYELLDVFDVDYFSLNSETGQLYAKSSFDFEDPNHDNSYRVFIHARSSDVTTVINGNFYLTITNVNDNPTTWATNGNPTGNAGVVSENLAIGTSVADFNATGDGATPTYSLTHHQNAEYFAIDSNGVLTTKSVLDFEFQEYYSVIVSANSLDGSEAVTQHFVLTIANVDNTRGWADGTPDGITLSENLAIGVEVVDINALSAATGGGSITFGLSGDDADYFNIGQNNGTITFASVLDFETPANADNRYSIIIHSSATIEGNEITRLFVLTIADVDGAGLAPDPTTPDQPVGINGKILFDGTTETIGGINDGIGNDGLVIIGDDLVAIQFDNGGQTDLILNNIENFETSFVGYTDADGNDQNHWFFVRDDAGDNTGHIVFDADGLDVNLESLANSGATTTPDQINLLAALNFNNDGDFAKPDDLDLNLNNNSAASLTHDQFLALIGGSNNIDFV